jgi:hypothetical protein
VSTSLVSAWAAQLAGAEPQRGAESRREEKLLTRHPRERTFKAALVRRRDTTQLPLSATVCVCTRVGEDESETRCARSPGSSAFSESPTFRLSHLAHGV